MIARRASHIDIYKEFAILSYLLDPSEDYQKCIYIIELYKEIAILYHVIFCIHWRIARSVPHIDFCGEFARLSSLLDP